MIFQMKPVSISFLQNDCIDLETFFRAFCTF